MGVVLGGKVLDYYTSKGIEGVLIFLEKHNGFRERIYTDGNGIFKFLDISEPGLYKIIEICDETSNLNFAVQPNGYDGSLNERVYEIVISINDIKKNSTINYFKFFHYKRKEILELKSSDLINVSPVGDVFFIDTQNKALKLVDNIGIEANFIFYNKLDLSFYYFSGKYNNEIYKLLSYGSGVKIGELSLGFNLSDNIKATMDERGILYFMNTLDSKLYSINLNQNSLEYLKNSNGNTLNLNKRLHINDITYNNIDNNLYIITKANIINRINITSGECIELNTKIDCECNEIGVMIIDEAGAIFCIDNITGDIYKGYISLEGIDIKLLGQNTNHETFLSEEIVDTDRILIKKIECNEILIGNLQEFENSIIDCKITQCYNGTFSINKTNLKWTYIPNNNFKGIDKITLYLDTGIKKYNATLSIEVGYFESDEIAIDSESENNTVKNDEDKICYYDVLSCGKVFDDLNLYYRKDFNVEIKEFPIKGHLEINDDGTWEYKPQIFESGLDFFEILVVNLNGGYELRQFKINIIKTFIDIKCMHKNKKISFLNDIEYKFVIKNEGLIEAYNLVFNPNFSQLLRYRERSVKINGVNINNKAGKIMIDKLGVGEEVELSFNICLVRDSIMDELAISSLELITNFSTSEFLEKNISFSSKNIITNIINANIDEKNIKFFADHEVTTSGDVLEFSLILKNIGNTYIDKLYIKNLENNYINIIDNVILVNDEEYNYYSQGFGVKIENVNVGEIIKLHYKAKVLNIEANMIEVNPLIYYEFLIDDIVVNKSINTISYFIKHIKSNIDVKTLVSKEKAIIGDVLTVNTLINNKGIIKISNLNVKHYLEKGLEIVSDFIINGKQVDINEKNYIQIFNIERDEEIEIKFDVKVTDDIKNKKSPIYSNITYDYKLQNKTFEICDKSEIVNLFIYKNQLEVEYNYSKEKVGLNEELELNIIMKNIGEVNLDNLFLTYNNLSDLNILMVFNDNKKINKNISKGIDIGCLVINGTKNIKIIIELKNNKDLLEFESILINGLVRFDEFTEPSKFLCEKQIVNKIEVINPNLMILQSISNYCCAVHDILEMKLILVNVGDVLLEDIIITNILPKELEFIEGTIFIDNMLIENQSIISGIDVDKLAVDDSLEIRFKFKVLEKSKDSEIKTKTYGIYKYNINGNEYKNKGIYSNESSIIACLVDVKVTKNINKNFVVLGEEISYELTILNTGDIEALNVIFIDELLKGLKLVNRSFAIDGEVVNNIDITRGIIIGNIKPGFARRINYKVKVLQTDNSVKLKTKTLIKFAYILPNGRNSTALFNIDTCDDERIDMALSNFKLLNTGTSINLGECNADINEIDNVTSDIEVDNYYILETPIIQASDSKRLTGYKVVVTGRIINILEYTTENDGQSVYSMKYEIPFSNHIVLSNNFEMSSCLEIVGVVNDVYYKKIDTRRFYSDAIITLIAKILNSKEEHDSGYYKKFN